MGIGIPLDEMESQQTTEQQEEEDTSMIKNDSENEKEHEKQRQELIDVLEERTDYTHGELSQTPDRMLVSIAEGVIDSASSEQTENQGEAPNLSGVPRKFKRVNLAPEKDDLDAVVPAGGDYDGWRRNQDSSYRTNRVSEDLEDGSEGGRLNYKQWRRARNQRANAREAPSMRWWVDDDSGHSHVGPRMKGWIDDDSGHTKVGESYSEWLADRQGGLSGEDEE